MTQRRAVAAVVAVVGAVAFVVLAVAAGAVGPGARWRALHPARARVRAHRRSRSRGPRTYAGPARWLGWGSLVGLAGGRVLCWASPRRARGWSAGCAGRWWWRVGARRSAARAAGRPARHPAVRGRLLPPPRARLRPVHTRRWPECARDVAVSWAVNVVATSLVAARRAVGTRPALARAWWPAVAGRLAGGPGDARARSSTRCWSSRSSTPSRRCPTARCAPRSCGWPTEEHVHVDDVLVADASRRTTTLNAYVSGLRQRPGAWCSTTTWSSDVPQDQVLSVVAHELAHARHDDVLTGLAARRGRSRAGDRPARAAARATAEGAGGARKRKNRRGSGGGATGAGPGGGGGPAGQPDPERDQPADRDPGRRRRACWPRRTRRRSSRCSGSWRPAPWPT